MEPFILTVRGEKRPLFAGSKMHSSVSLHAAARTNSGTEPRTVNGRVMRDW